MSERRGSAVPSETPFNTSPDRPRCAIEALGDSIAELSARLTAATYELLVLIRDFDDRQGWTGFSSCADWLGWRTGLGPVAAREKVRVAHALGALPRISEAMHRGEISYSKVRAITRVATPDTEEDLLDVARSGTASHVERIVRAWRRVDRVVAAQEGARRDLSRRVQVWVDDDGMVVIRGRLTPEVGAVVLRALEAATDRLWRGAATGGAKDASPTAGLDPAEEVPAEEITAEQRRADALGLMAECALSADLDAGQTADRYQVVLHVDDEALRRDAAGGQATFEDPPIHVSAEASQRIACDASMVVMRHDRDGQVLDVGRKTRTIPPAIRRALRTRDQRCRFPGCRARRCDAHHVHHWADGGATTLGNLVLLCRRHHRAVHEGGFTVVLDRDGSVSFFRPDGTSIPSVPSAPRWDGPPLRAASISSRDPDIRIAAHTATPHWRGEPLDVSWAIDVLHPAARGVPPRDSAEA